MGDRHLPTALQDDRVPAVAAILRQLDELGRQRRALLVQVHAVDDDIAEAQIALDRVRAAMPQSSHR